jgi:predicted deacylase
VKKSLTIGLTSAGSGERAHGSLGHVELADGSKVSIPIILINGKSDGPVLTVVSGIHGTELTGVAAVLEAANQINPAKLKGAFIGIPGANPFACRDGDYKNPYDASNDVGSNVFSLPADPTMSQRMSYLVGQALTGADYVIDMHCNPLPSIPFSLMNTGICKDERTKVETEKICEAFGATVIAWSRPGRTIRDVCVERGIPAITPELAGNIYLLDDCVKVGTTGILNVMKAVGMLDGKPEAQPGAKLKGNFVAVGRLVANRGGLLFVRKYPGTKVKKGETVAEILDVYGQVAQVVTMPHTGYCWSFTGGIGGSHAINEGDKIAYTFAEVKDLAK